jgi:general secretion pathway protein H
MCRRYSQFGKRRANVGFTLLELLVVMVILTIVSTVTAVRFSGGIENARLRAETRQLIALLRAARIEAMVSSSVTGIDSDTADTGYLSYPAQQRIELPEGIAIDIASTATATGATQQAIRFYPDGSSSGGDIQLSSAAGSFAITVGWLTGEVSLANVD